MNPWNLKSCLNELNIARIEKWLLISFEGSRSVPHPSELTGGVISIVMPLVSLGGVFEGDNMLGDALYMGTMVVPRSWTLREEPSKIFAPPCLEDGLRVELVRLVELRMSWVVIIGASVSWCFLPSRALATDDSLESISVEAWQGLTGDGGHRSFSGIVICSQRNVNVTSEEDGSCLGSQSVRCQNFRLFVGIEF